MPPARVAATTASRTTIGSTPSARATPAQTPATMPRSGSRRRAGGAVRAAVIVASVPPREAGHQQDDAQRRADHGGQHGEGQVDGARAIEQLEDAERHDGEAGGEADPVDGAPG